jgi:hypothetical protein
MKKLFTLLTLGIVFCSVSAYGAWTEISRSTASSEVTMATVTARVRLMIDDPTSDTGTVRYSTATLYDMVNTAHKNMCVATLALETSATQSLVAGTTEYLLPSNEIAIARVTINLNDGNGDTYLPQTTVHVLDSKAGKSWSVSRSSPTVYYLRNRYIGFYPAPTGSPVVTIWYYKIPDTMTTGSDYVFEGFKQLELYWEALASYVAYKILVAEGRTLLLDQLVAEYRGAISAIKSWINLKPDLELDIEGATYENYNNNSR